MIKQLIFSKNRPLQLDAIIKSSIQNSELSVKYINVLTDYQSGQDQRYNDIMYDYNINLLTENKETGFIGKLTEFIDDQIKLQNQINRRIFIWFSTDDAIYWRKFDLREILACLNNKEILGFSLRLGRNIIGYDDICSKIGWLSLKVGKFLVWNSKGFGSHWGYPFDVTNSIYSVDLIKEILERFGSRIRIPNDLETYGVQVSQEKNQYLCCYDDWTSGGALDINIVQTLYPNSHSGTDQTTPEKLIELYDCGYRIDIDKYKDIKPLDPFIGKSHGLELYKKL